MGLNDVGHDISDNQTSFGSTWTVETNVSSNPEELSSRGIGLQGRVYIIIKCTVFCIVFY